MEAVIALLILAVLFIAFCFELYPPEVLATGAAAAFIVLGFVTEDEIGAAFANPAPITIAAMFVMSGALLRTGVLDALAAIVIARVEKQAVIGLALFAMATLAASAFVNNTPVVLVFIPIVVRLAERLQFAPTRLLIPLSYVSILGGACTLIGTSTNLLVDGVARQAGLEPFQIFEIAPVGLCAAAAGILLLVLIGPRVRNEKC